MINGTNKKEDQAKLSIEVAVYNILDELNLDDTSEDMQVKLREIVKDCINDVVGIYDLEDQLYIE